jgi:hypothetical protein
LPFSRNIQIGRSAVGIAAFKDKRAVLDILAPDVEVEDGHGKSRAVLDHRIGEADGNAFAARLAVDVGSGHADRTHLLVLSEPVLHSLTRCQVWSETAPAGQWRQRQKRPMPLGPSFLIKPAVTSFCPVQTSGN